MTKTTFDNTVSSFDTKIEGNKSLRALLQRTFKKLKSPDLGYFKGKNHFGEYGAQNYLVFQPLNNYLTFISSTKYILSSKSKGLSNETIKPVATSDNSFTPSNYYYADKIRVKLNGSILRQPEISYTHLNIVNIYIVYESGASSSHINDPTLKSCLFGAVTLTKNVDIDKYGYSSYGIGFDRRSGFSFPGGGFGQNVSIFGADLSSSAYFDNKKKDILVLGKGLTQGLEHTLTEEKMYSINFTVTKTKFYLSLHYNGANSYLLFNGSEIYKFNAKDSEIVATPLCLGNISKD